MKLGHNWKKMMTHTGFHLARVGLIAFVLFAAVGPVTETKAQKRARFDPDGSFWIYGTPPKDFENFSGINLNSKRSRRLPGSGVDLTNGNQLKFKTLTVRQDKFLFTTVVVRGISYNFSGRFLKGGVFAEASLDDQTPVLEGTLTKLQRGRKVAEARLSFTYFGGT